MGQRVMYNLILHQSGAIHGVSIVADIPECNDLMLSIKILAVLRHYYGCDIEKIGNNSVK